jgi:hypothetical protein
MSRQFPYGPEVGFFPKHGERVYVMRRPINWFVFCLSLATLYANLSFGHKPGKLVVQAAPVTAELDFSHVVLGDSAPPQFGYVRADGSFLPLAQQPAPKPDVDVEIVELSWAAPAVASKVPARF